MRVNQTHIFHLFKQQTTLLVTIIIAVCFAFLKLKGIGVDQTLWAEDGTVFINQARELGVSSLFVTYAGYFHAYPRLIAWISSFFGLQQTPLIFLSAWFLAYISLIYVATNRLLKCELAPLSACIIVILMLAQPHSGEVFFTLTNAQWFTGAALAIYVLIPVIDTSSIYEKAILLLVSLTGPFSLLLTPLLLIQLLIYKDWYRRKYIYIILGFGALVQLSAILLVNRFSNGSFDHDISHWVTAFYNFMSFGFKPAIPKIASMLFWLTFFYALALGMYGKGDRSYYSKKIILLLLLFGALLFWCAGLVAVKTTPQLLNPLQDGARYFFIPYILIFFATGLLVSKHTKLKYIIFCALTILAILAFIVSRVGDLQFNSFVKFTKYNSNVFIPINPQGRTFPGWHIRLPRNSQLDGRMLAGNNSDLPIQNIVSSRVHFVTLNGSQLLVLDIHDRCTHSQDIGLEFKINRLEDGVAQIFWSKNIQFNEEQSLRRYYPSGNTTMQFALPRGHVKNILFDPVENSGKFNINSIHLYCLGN
jgi:hypothetical protein